MVDVRSYARILLDRMEGLTGEGAVAAARRRSAAVAIESILAFIVHTKTLSLVMLLMLILMVSSYMSLTSVWRRGSLTPWIWPKLQPRTKLIEFSK